MMKRHNQEAITLSRRRWELHLRPVLNLKEKEGIHQFRSIATEVAVLVKNTVVQVVNMETALYEGSFTFMIGDKIMNY
jgi:hypothetical protein